MILRIDRRRIAGLVLVIALSLTPAATSAAPPSLSLSQMVGQLIVVGFNGTEPNSPGVQSLLAEAKAGRIGGVLLFGNNVQNPAQVRRLTSALHQTSERPFMVAVDQEGGAVQRLTARNGFVSTPSAADMANRRDGEAQRLYRRMAGALVDVGITANLAPVVDLNINPNNTVIGRVGRSYGKNPQRVALYADAFVRAHRDAGVITALKHFPGHGSSRGDTHNGFVDVTDTWSKRELAPFKALVEAGKADMVMVAHVALKEEAGQLLPATLSRAVVGGLLRRDVGFGGVAISDDLEMGAVRALMGREEAAVAALTAGIDLMVFAAHGSDPGQVAQQVHGALLRAAKADPVLRRRVAEAYGRVAALKARYPMKLRQAATGVTAARTASVPVPRTKPAR